ncbi:MAG: FHA domain-containing protein [Alphaproteobacteria bacterium]
MRRRVAGAGVVWMSVYTIGRSNSSNIVLPDNSVSRAHAEITVVGDGRYRVVDLSSTYGTFVKKDGVWTKVQNATLGADDPLMFGKYKTTPYLLISLLQKQPPAAGERRASGADGRVTRRKLAAILAADVVGYSKLMGADETGTLNTLRLCRRELFDPKVDEHGGRIFKLIGDGIMVEFASVVDAVRCAVEIQNAMPGRNIGRPPTLALIFRMGINLGDVIAEGDDLMGDGVNIAARLESIAEAGGIAIAGSVYDQVKNKLIDLAFEDLGSKTVKNIAEPIRVYKVGVRSSGRTVTTSSDSDTDSKRKPAKPE